MTVGTVLDKIESMNGIMNRARENKIVHESDRVVYEISTNDFYSICAIFNQYKELLCKMEVEE